MTHNDKKKTVIIEDIHNKSLIDLYKTIGKKELEKENFNKIIKFITEIEQKEIIDNKEKYQEMTIIDLQKKLNSYNQEGFYKSCLYFKHIEDKKVKKELRVLKESNSDLDEMIDRSNEQLDDIEKENKKLLSRIDRLRHKLVDKNKYILLIEKILMLFITILFVLDFYYQTNASSTYINILTSFNIIGVVNCLILGGIFIKILYSRPKVKVIKLT